MTESKPTHKELVEQAEKVLKATKKTSYSPRAYNEAEILQSMIQERSEVTRIDD